MTREEALDLMRQYDDFVRWQRGTPDTSNNYDKLKDCSVIGIRDRFPDDGSEKKAMRWLGFCQGVVVALGMFSLEEVKKHSKDREISW